MSCYLSSNECQLLINNDSLIVTWDLKKGLSDLGVLDTIISKISYYLVRDWL